MQKINTVFLLTVTLLSKERKKYLENPSTVLAFQGELFARQRAGTLSYKEIPHTQPPTLF